VRGKRLIVVIALCSVFVGGFTVVFIQDFTRGFKHGYGETYQKSAVDQKSISTTTDDEIPLSRRTIEIIKQLDDIQNKINSFNDATKNIYEASSENDREFLLDLINEDIGPLIGSNIALIGMLKLADYSGKNKNSEKTLNVYLGYLNANLKLKINSFKQAPQAYKLSPKAQVHLLEFSKIISDFLSVIADIQSGLR